MASMPPVGSVTPNFSWLDDPELTPPPTLGVTGAPLLDAAPLYYWMTAKTQLAPIQAQLGTAWGLAVFVLATALATGQDRPSFALPLWEIGGALQVEGDYIGRLLRKHRAVLSGLFYWADLKYDSILLDGRRVSAKMFMVPVHDVSDRVARTEQAHPTTRVKGHPSHFRTASRDLDSEMRAGHTRKCFLKRGKLQKLGRGQVRGATLRAELTDLGVELLTASITRARGGERSARRATIFEAFAALHTRPQPGATAAWVLDTGTCIAQALGDRDPRVWMSKLWAALRISMTHATDGVAMLHQVLHDVLIRAGDQTVHSPARLILWRLKQHFDPVAREARALLA
ncbi:hypothetical protein [Deinococcus soli (ex Cha et al. 2016)]|uniref:Uncharacterized protein n=2 Tax=Deinococcus soli (ex Cha et al. 2016) TaxID=1309411 RepID=A0ACC6KG90_9DEIO|nr:hypothetical protein [Deinococcus soli (ex Cha et al. 2016)]MDR6218178.1 hypothetical protein [Deinococcus soli (ex Cha et al. 2016)]MDR6328918.1 hypothetical protein [Deinococcus soli (ex Cha et al. 2016)]MDR6751594.1 hypothetical protein [Deinococcus soli (ex Cha et al. 2016)]